MNLFIILLLITILFFVFINLCQYDEFVQLFINSKTKFLLIASVIFSYLCQGPISITLTFYICFIAIMINYELAHSDIYTIDKHQINKLIAEHEKDLKYHADRFYDYAYNAVFPTDKYYPEYSTEENGEYKYDSQAALQRFIDNLNIPNNDHHYNIIKISLIVIIINIMIACHN